MSLDLPAVDPVRITALATELRERLGDATVSDEPQVLERVSVDGSYLSPIVSGQYPLGAAQLVAYPTRAEDFPVIVGAAVRHGVPITPRGKGTGNYGQGIPMAGGLVLDTSKARRLVEIGDGFIVADAGASVAGLEQAANKTGQELLMYPSTANSTIGGFVSGGSGGTGSIKNGMLHTGVVTALDVVHAVPDAELIHVAGVDTEPYLHKYGTAGIIARVTMNLEPLQPWRAFLASFDDFQAVLDLIRPFSALQPTPRLVSGDQKLLAEALPADPAIPPGRASLRAILDVASVDAARRLVEERGGRVEDVRDGAQATMRLSMISYNHPIEWLQKAYPGTYFHVEVTGDVLTERIEEIEAVYPGGALHVEGQQGRPIGMLAGRFESPERVYAGFERLAALGVGFHNPHQWYVDYEPDATLAFAATADPQGLLNPGKLVRAQIETGSQL